MDTCINPAETGLYYVSSRYYDPEIGRWINADNQIAGVGGEILGYNMFAYCMNNPVNMSDPSGNWPRWATIQSLEDVFLSAFQSESYQLLRDNSSVIMRSTEQSQDSFSSGKDKKYGTNE